MAAHELSGEQDDALIRRIGERDRAAFEALYRRFARPVLGLGHSDGCAIVAATSRAPSRI
jgi:hypothetical protein